MNPRSKFDDIRRRKKGSPRKQLTWVFFFFKSWGKSPEMIVSEPRRFVSWRHRNGRRRKRLEEGKCEGKLRPSSAERPRVTTLPSRNLICVCLHTCQWGPPCVGHWSDNLNHRIVGPTRSWKIKQNQWLEKQKCNVAHV